MCCQGVRPFSPYQAVGVRILYSVARGRYAATDVYWAHAALSADDKADVVLVSDRCVRQSWRLTLTSWPNWRDNFWNKTSVNCCQRFKVHSLSVID